MGELSKIQNEESWSFVQSLLASKREVDEGTYEFSYFDVYLESFW